MVKIILLFIMFTLFTSCNNEETLSYEKYLEYISDESNGLTKTQELNGLKYEATFIPSEIRQYVNLKKTGKKVKLSTNVGFKVKISMINGKDILKSNISSIKDYNMELMYLNTEMQKDFIIISGVDTTCCNLIVPEYLDGITPFITLNIIFSPKRKRLNNDIRLVYTDNLFSGEKINYLFDNNILKNLPKLK
jgi:hypothetical protein